MIESNFLDGNSKIINDLKKIPVLTPFKGKELNRLLKMSKLRKYKPGELICREGAHDTWVYFLAYGSVRVEKKGKTLCVLDKKGEIFGEMGAIDGSPRSASVYANDKTVCLATNAHMIEKLKGNDKAAFGYIMYKIFAEILAARMRTANRELIYAKEGVFKNLIKRICESEFWKRFGFVQN